jgi:hypothetical protein
MEHGEGMAQKRPAMSHKEELVATRVQHNNDKPSKSTVKHVTIARKCLLLGQRLYTRSARPLETALDKRIENKIQISKTKRERLGNREREYDTRLICLENDRVQGLVESTHHTRMERCIRGGG